MSTVTRRKMNPKSTADFIAVNSAMQMLVSTLMAHPDRIDAVAQIARDAKLTSVAAAVLCANRDCDNVMLVFNDVEFDSPSEPLLCLHPEAPDFGRYVAANCDINW